MYCITRVQANSGKPCLISTWLHDSAGAAYLELDGYETLVQATHFLHNKVENVEATGALYVGKSGLVFVGQSVSSMLYMINSTFAYNSGAAGSLSLESLQCAALSNVTFTGNMGSSAAAMWIEGTSTDPNLCASSVPNSTFGDQVAFQPRLFDPFGAVMTNSSYTASNPFSIDLRHLVVADSTGEDAAAIRMSDNQQDVAISHSSFTNNTANQAGALRFAGTSAATIKFCNFTDNAATAGDGGALAFDGLAQQLVLADCAFRGNAAAFSGGAVSVATASVDIQRCSFVNNHGGLLGGGAFTCRDCVRVSVSDSTLNANKCSEMGGAIKITGIYPYTILMDNIQATNNRWAYAQLCVPPFLVLTFMRHAPDMLIYELSAPCYIKCYIKTLCCI